MSESAIRKTPEKVARASIATTSISFVSFDGSSSSDASRKAVRKQAALSSAAARKATIAKKNAKRRVENEAETKQEDISSTSSVGEHRERVKRKRSDEVLSETRPWQWQAGVSIIASSLVSRTDSSCVMSAQQSRSACGFHSRALTPLPDSPGLENAVRYSRGHPETLTRVKAEGPEAHSQHITPLRVERSGILSNDHTHDHDDSYECRLPVTPESLASPQSHSASIVDPFNQYPVPYHPLYDRLLHHMMTIFAPRGWSSIKITYDEGVAWESFMTRHALAEPALFLVRLLFASGDLIRVGVLDPKVAIALRTLAIQAINEALSDPGRCISDGLILAVGRIALNETLYGDKSAASLHRPAQRRMISLRGGMHALDFPPLVKRLMRWSDRVMSVQTNTPRLILDEEDGGNTTLTMKESLNLVEDWVPVEAQAMRKKIAIADLIT